jgi:predicted amino acid-binding ACT domain protein
MTRWFILSAIGRDRPAWCPSWRGWCSTRRELRLAHDDPRHHPAVILLCSRARRGRSARSAEAARATTAHHPDPRFAAREAGDPAPGRLYRVEAAGEVRAGIVAGICGVLAEHGVNIVELDTQSRPGQGGEPHYQMTIRAEVPDGVDPRALRDALEREAERLVLDVALMPA